MSAKSELEEFKKEIEAFLKASGGFSIESGDLIDLVHPNGCDYVTVERLEGDK